MKKINELLKMAENNEIKWDGVAIISMASCVSRWSRINGNDFDKEEKTTIKDIKQGVVNFFTEKFVLEHWDEFLKANHGFDCYSEMGQYGWSSGYYALVSRLADQLYNPTFFKDYTAEKWLKKTLSVLHYNNLNDIAMEIKATAKAWIENPTPFFWHIHKFVLGKTKTIRMWQKNVTVCQIVAEFSNPRLSLYKGKLGGWVEEESNLAQNGEGWIDENSIVGGGSVITHMRVENSTIWGENSIKGEGYIENSILFGNNKIEDKSEVRINHCYLRGGCDLYGKTRVENLELKNIPSSYFDSDDNWTYYRAYSPNDVNVIYPLSQYAKVYKSNKEETTWKKEN